MESSAQMAKQRTSCQRKGLDAKHLLSRKQRNIIQRTGRLKLTEAQFGENYQRRPRQNISKRNVFLA